MNYINEHVFILRQRWVTELQTAGKHNGKNSTNYEYNCV